MNWFLNILLLTSTLLATEQVEFYKTSFDCQKVDKKSTAYKICTNEKLANLDSKLTLTFNTLKNTIYEKKLLKELMIDRVSFLTQRDKCKDNECIKDIYKNQINILLKIFSIYGINNIYASLKKVTYASFVNTDNKKNTMFTKELQKLIKNKNAKSIPFKNIYLFTLNNNQLGSGLYCANNISGEVLKQYGGNINTWQGFKEKDSLKVVAQTNSGRKGLGYTNLIILNIDKNCSITKNKTILEYNYDMESGLCGRDELNLEKSADIKTLDFDIEKKILKLTIQEQQCTNKKISNINLLFDISTEKFIK